MSKWEQRRDDDETRLAEEASCHFGPCMGPKTIPRRITTPGSDSTGNHQLSIMHRRGVCDILARMRSRVEWVPRCEDVLLDTDFQYIH